MSGELRAGEGVASRKAGGEPSLTVMRNGSVLTGSPSGSRPTAGEVPSSDPLGRHPAIGWTP
ncbi:hypothetical protein [Streptomyces sp. NPDC101166]|uniref:hypothetical protein n=1 Tax=Streptomyces sp. NPDC101166 TaxID=3366120 RepID=UPI0037F8C410